MHLGGRSRLYSGPSPGLSTVNGHTYYLNGMQMAGVDGVPRGVGEERLLHPRTPAGLCLRHLRQRATVLRGGVGMFYERVQGNDIYNLSTNPPFSYQPSVNNVYFSDPHTNDLTGASVHGSDWRGRHDQHEVLLSQSGDGAVQPRRAASAGAFCGHGGAVCRLEGWNQDDLREINDLPLSARRTAPGGGQPAARMVWMPEREPLPPLPRIRQSAPGRKRRQLQLQLAAGRPAHG